MNGLVYSVSQFVGVVNQILETAVPFVKIQGEISNYQVRAGKWVSFKLKDEQTIVECFGSVWQVQTPLHDGMEVVVSGNPRLSAKWGKFSVSLQSVRPVGEGSILKSLKLLQAKLEKEGIFDDSRKRVLPEFPSKIGVVSSPQADGYKDFLKITKERWPSAEITLAETLVQGDAAPKTIEEAITKLNQTEIDVIAIVRGGGSMEDLLAFSSENVVRAVAASRVPTVVGVGHEADISLAQLAADRAAATPTHAAQLITPDRLELIQRVEDIDMRMSNQLQLQVDRIYDLQRSFTVTASYIASKIADRINSKEDYLRQYMNSTLERHERNTQYLLRVLHQFNPSAVLKQGYAMIRKDGKVTVNAAQLTKGDTINIQMRDAAVSAEVK